ncbi:MAG: hypothetical protein QOG42_1688 [Solirubrobacteraceae bacterium]|jgi:hypothetical protein|nr:hypothetical protein [Solirubrobacteraceae bacterium]
MPGTMKRSIAAVLGACALTLVGAAPAHAVATLAADTTRQPSGDPAALGTSPNLTVGGLDQAVALLRFRVRGLGGPATRAVLRLRTTAATAASLPVRALPAAFGEDDGTPAQLAPEPAIIASVVGAQVGAWVEWDVTSAVHGDGDVGLQVSGSVVDAASFSSREGPDAPQLVVTPDDDRGARLAGLLDPLAADAFVAHARNDLGNSLDALDVIAAPPGQGAPGRYIGVHHSLVGNNPGVFVTKVATSDDLTTWTQRGDLASHASQPTLAALPDGGFVLAFERDTPDPKWVSVNNLAVRHYASWAALVAGSFDREVDLPRTLAPTAEGTPALDVRSWNGPDASQIAITFHYFENIDVDRQATGVLTNFSAAGWAPQADAALNTLFAELGTRGNLGDRADLLFEGHPFAVFEAQSIKSDFGTWRWFLYDRERAEARRIALRLPGGSYALGNPTVRALTGPAGQPLLLFSGYVFSQGAGAGEAGQFIALRNAATAAPAPPAETSPPVVVATAPPAPPPLAAVVRPPAPVAADTTAPRATVSAATQRLATTVAATIGCPDEACRATTSGTLRIPKLGRVKAKTHRLAAVTTTLAQGARAKVRLVLSPTLRVTIRRALRAGRRIAVTLHVRVADTTGNARTLTRQFRLRL